MAVSFISLNTAKAQRMPDADTIKTITADTVVHSSKKATLLSAVLPGAGQVYNKKYWKVPVIYAGFGVLIAVISFNQKNYKEFQEAYKYRVDEDPGTVDDYPQYTDDNLLTLREYYRRNRDLTYVLTGLLYVLNILDAYVDAEMFKFDINDDLTLRGEPYILNYAGGNSMTGLRLSLNF